MGFFHPENFFDPSYVIRIRCSGLLSPRPPKPITLLPSSLEATLMPMKYIGFSITFVVLLTLQCTTRSAAPTEVGPPILPTRELNAAFLIVDGVYNSELIAPMDVFHHTVFHAAKGIRVFTVAASLNTVTTFEGLKIIPDFSFVSDSLPPIDILIVPSAKHSMDTDLQDVAMVKFVSDVEQQASYVMSLCDGAFVLAQAGLLNQHDCTTFPGDIAKFRVAYPQLTIHENVSFVHDRKIITSAGGAKSYESALYLVELLYGKKVANGIADGLVIAWDVSAVPAVLSRR